ncbi:MAG: hypothetical protein QOJ25_2446 [Solirubrobacteraceae bacterium]|jgi:hypothetical protein|nr:hypothetical protein [Solirubrobacteraceae bacterium]
MTYCEAPAACRVLLKFNDRPDAEGAKMTLNIKQHEHREPDHPMHNEETEVEGPEVEGHVMHMSPISRPMEPAQKADLDR